MATVDQVFSLTARQGEVIKRVKSGSLPIEDALEGTQGILERKYPIKAAPVTWEVSPQEQLLRMWNLNEARGWGFTWRDFVDLEFLLATIREGEQPLLCVYPSSYDGRYSVNEAFDEFWGLAQLPVGWSRIRDRYLRKRADRHVRPIYGIDQRPRLRWVAYNPCFAAGMSAAMARQEADKTGVQLAGVEVLMALAMRGDWDGRPETITMSGLRFMNLDTVPVVHWAARRTLRLDQTNKYTLGLDCHPSIRDLET